MANGSQKHERSWRELWNLPEVRPGTGLGGALGYCRGPPSTELLFARPCCRSEIGSAFRSKSALIPWKGSEQLAVWASSAQPWHGTHPADSDQDRAAEGNSHLSCLSASECDIYVASWLFPSMAPEVLTGVSRFIVRIQLILTLYH